MDKSVAGLKASLQMKVSMLMRLLVKSHIRHSEWELFDTNPENEDKSLNSGRLDYPMSCISKIYSLYLTRQTTSHK